MKDLGILNACIDVREIDSFEHALKNQQSFDICVTNPPWETIKPDSRELAKLEQSTREVYVSLLKEKAFWLEEAYHTPSQRESFLVGVPT